MYIDLIIVILVLILVIFFFRKFSSFVYAIAIIDIFLRIMDFLAVKIPLKELGNILPNSIPDILNNYLKDTVLDIFLWGYVIIYIFFLVYITNYFIHKKK